MDEQAAVRVPVAKRLDMRVVDVPGMQTHHERRVAIKFASPQQRQQDLDRVPIDKKESAGR
jgi:hypothetical protein